MKKPHPVPSEAEVNRAITWIGICIVVLVITVIFLAAIIAFS